MKAALCNQTLENALTAYPALEGAVIHSDYAEENTMPKILNSLDIIRNA